MIETHKYGMTRRVGGSAADAEVAIRAALADEGFGILSEIDVAATFKAKLDIDRGPYKILGACNPVLANRALAVDEEMGLLLPCNVVVYESGDDTVVSILEPEVMSTITDAAEVVDIAAEAKERLRRALEAMV